MRTQTKIWLVIAAALILLGCILFAGTMATVNWDFMKLSTDRYETNTYVIYEPFDGISINTDTANIVFVLSKDETCTVGCYEDVNAKHSVTVENDILTVKMIDTRDVTGYIGINFESPEITFYLPQAEYAKLSIHGDTGAVRMPKDFLFKDVDISLSTGDVEFRASASEIIKMKTSTGNICVEHLSAGMLDLTVSTGEAIVSNVNCDSDVTVRVSTGKAYLTDVVCNNVISSGNTGDIELNEVIASEKFSIERSTGDVKFNGSDAGEIYVKTNTGDVTGSLLTDKVFVVRTGTGDIHVPKTVTGGICEITTSTGDIKLEIQ